MKNVILLCQAVVSTTALNNPDVAICAILVLGVVAIVLIRAIQQARPDIECPTKHGLFRCHFREKRSAGKSMTK